MIPYFERFMARFPTLAALADADDDEVMAHWAGLGYYSRARNLKRAAERCVEEHGGALPENLEALVDLPGIGRSTAGAILSLACDQRHPILDGNVKRVLARRHGIDGWPGRSAVLKSLWEIAERETPVARVADYTQAIMDLGATLCTPRDPNCGECPVNRDCRAAEVDTPERFPGRKPRRELPERHRFGLLIVEDGALVLERRPPVGLWGGLYALPLVEDLHDIGVARPTAAPIRHTFTHFRLILTPVLVSDGLPSIVADLDTRRVTASDITALGMPQPIAALVRAHFQGELSWQEQFIA